MESKIGNRYGARVLWVLATGLWLILMAGAWHKADASEKETYNFSWLDPDKKIYVLQNRKFEKAGRLMISALGGLGWSNPYRNVLTVEPRVGFYFSESVGIEAFYSKMFNSPSSTFDALQSAAPNKFPVLREFKSQVGGLFHWTPWYAKINVFNKILYFDWGFGAGLSVLNVDRLRQSVQPGPIDQVSSESYTAGILSTFQHFYLTQDWSVRLDLAGSFFNAAYNTAGDKTWFSNFQFGAGFGYRL